MSKSSFILLLTVKALVMILLILFAGIGLGPDEAQYWTWSRKLDWGYYSKPPGIAWQIFLGTALFGSTELGVRFMSVVLGTLLAWAVYRLGKASGLNEDQSILAGCVMALSPIGIFATFFALTDLGMLLFWTLALAELVKNPPNYLKMGLWIACGALFKWPIYWLWPIVLIALPFYPKWRSHKLFYGILISLLGLMPAIYWNAAHDWATFRHVFATMSGGHEGLHVRGNPLDFLGAQIALASPLLFILLIIAWFYLKRAQNALFFLGISSLCILLICLGYTFFKKGQGNWALFAYPGAFVFLASIWYPKRKWVWGALWLSILLTAFVFAVPSLQKHNLFSAIKIPWKINPFHHNLGWNELKKIRSETNQFLAGDRYQIASELSFYNPAQEQAYFLNLSSIRKNQFSYWEQPKKGEDAMFIVVENAPHLKSKLKEQKNKYLPLLKPYFNAIEEPEELALFTSYGNVVKSALVFRCFGFKGQMPPDPENY